jgi:hypothetical protein
MLDMKDKVSRNGEKFSGDKSDAGPAYIATD